MDPSSLDLLRSAVNGEEQPSSSIGDIASSSETQLTPKQSPPQTQSPGTNPKKRKPSDGNGESTNPEKKKRSSIAFPGSKRRRSKRSSTDTAQPAPLHVYADGAVNPQHISNDDVRRLSGASTANSPRNLSPYASQHVPHSIYQSAIHAKESTGIDGQRLAQLTHSASMTDYLWAKSALRIPSFSLRNALLRSFIEYVHPYMPLLELHKVLQIINDEGGSGSMSLLLFQSIMFSGTAFVDIKILNDAGYSSRKAARKSFFQSARVLYDLDYETDMLTVVQSLLLMTYWYETPEDYKDTWHWMGRAIDHAYTLALHRDPKGMDVDQKLRKRVWWSCFMRDRLIALGMRRPTRVKDEDCDVPMLTEDDFEIKSGLGGPIFRSRKTSRCVSSEVPSTTSSIMLFPKKSESSDEVERCDLALDDWKNNLPRACVYSDKLKVGNSGRPLFVACSLLHMIYFTTASALHRPRVLPVGPNHQQPETLFELSREVVTKAAKGTTKIYDDMHRLDLERYLPTTGVTALLPAIIIHLLLVRSPYQSERQPAIDGFCLCMTVLEGLKDNYASADYATQFLEAAVRKAELERMQRSIAERITPPADTHLNGFEPLEALVDNSAAVYNGILAHSPPDSDAILGGAGSALPPDPNDMFEFLNMNYNEGGESAGYYDMDLFTKEIPGFGSRMPSPQPGDILFSQEYMT
ncbi:hypothetical protein DID88_008411 [Monilinia fructigena]|uniref:Xylanolytic transcriptional activator regulatory domain-containing protein n=1 Tax=Monilinia fructigena TaxID=38457 RepID=A0A395J5B8_9HELO|nr:hypothetical protein DID88_008411 [Monilinia fructigena]